jgi:hypothetical protein
MAQKITVEGKIDDKPLPPELKTKVQNALKSSLETELKTPGLVPSHHFSVTHYSVVYDKT